MDVRALVERGQKLFEKRRPLLPFWQEIADHFYPERADFTTTRYLGDEFASHLQTSYPVLVRRDLGNAFSSMLRPSDREWFSIRADREEREDRDARRWLETMTGRQRRAMADKEAQFARATKEGDHDFAAFGQAVITAELDLNPISGPTLLYRNWHLRDTVWEEAYNGAIGEIHRDWKPHAQDLVKRFKKVHPKAQEIAEKEPYREIECRHVVMTRDDYARADGKRQLQPWVSIYLDVENQHIMEEAGSWTRIYVLPRWQTVSGSQYAYSPATVAALPDARLIQAMTLTLLEAGEWAVSPPLLATEEALRSELALYSRGVTWVDAEYDEKKGAAVQALDTRQQNMGFGIELSDRTSALIAQAFYLNKLSLPQMEGDMTAFEVGQRIQEYVRNALPIFEPMEDDYNGQLCEDTFELSWRHGLFGPLEDLPQSLRGESTHFRFESPLREAQEREKGQRFLEAKTMLREAAELDPTAMVHVDPHRAVRDVLSGIGTPAKWMPSEEQAAQMIQGMKEAQAAQAMIAGAGGVAEAAKTAAEATQAFNA